MDISSLLSTIEISCSADLSSSSSTSGASSSSSSVDFSCMTISQIRDITDKLAIEGKLTDLQQIELICNGLQDYNATDKSYQPDTDGVGYSRSDTNTYNISDMISGYAEFDSDTGNVSGANIFKGIEQALQNYANNSDSSSSTSSSSVSASA